MSANEWLTVREAAEYLKVKARTLLMWVRRGHIKAYALSGSKRRVWRFLRADLDNALFANPVLESDASSVALHPGGTIQ